MHATSPAITVSGALASAPGRPLFPLDKDLHGRRQTVEVVREAPEKRRSGRSEREQHSAAHFLEEDFGSAMDGSRSGGIIPRSCVNRDPAYADAKAKAIGRLPFPKLHVAGLGFQSFYLLQVSRAMPAHSLH